MNTTKLIGRLNSKQRESAAGMLAELDAKPEFFDIEAFRENLISMLKRQFERLLSDNKRSLDNATDDGEIMRLVAEDKRLKRDWLDIQTNIRGWSPVERETST